MKASTFFWLVAVLLLFGVGVYQEYYFRKKERNDFVKINAAEIDGIIENIYEGGSGVHLTIAGFDSEFVFKYHLDLVLNRNKTFSNVVKRGDLIKKHPYSDTITVITSSGNYKYIFIRF